MQPTPADYLRTLQRIYDGEQINTLRQDYVYELFRRGLLEVAPDNHLQLSEAGKAACENSKPSGNS